MDDLSGLTFTSNNTPNTNTTSSQPNYNPAPTASNYTSLRPSPAPQNPGNLSLPPPNPLHRPRSTTPTATSKPTTGTNDSFGSLLNLNSQKRAANANLSIAERQRQVEEARQKQLRAEEGLWEGLGSSAGGSRGGTPEIRTPGVGGGSGNGGMVGRGLEGGGGKQEEQEEDILAAFNRAAPVDAASHFPPPSRQGTQSGRGTPTGGLQAAAGNGGFAVEGEEDDDPFGLGAGPERKNGAGSAAPQSQQLQVDDDDILGDLGRPVSAKPTPGPPAQKLDLTDPQAWGAPPRQPSPPQDRGVAELVDMGFAAETSKIALAETGGNVQAAVGWLLEQAHAETSQKQKGQNGQDGRAQRLSPRRTGSQGRTHRQSEGQPAWMRQEGRSGSATRRQASRSPANGDKDAAQMAQEMGSNFFKSANSLWKSSQKKMAKTLAEFQQGQEMDPNQPKWMRDASVDAAPPPPGQRRQEKAPVRKQQQRQTPDVTDEAAMLDMPREPAPPKPSRSPAPQQQQQQQRDLPTRGRSPADDLSARSSPQPRFMQQQPPPRDKRPATKLSRQEVENQTEQAYVSPARRKRPIPKPEPQPKAEVDLFSSPAPAPAPTSSAASSRSSKPAPAPVATRPKAPPRDVPAVSPSALSNSAKSRAAGTEAFKRGDFGTALEAYTAALSPLPANHPVAIIVHCNRALTALKNGDSKSALADSDKALEIIGPSRGDGEVIDPGGGEGTKEMKDFFSKALMRKAEALESLEKWSEAAATWRQAVEAGVGGAISIRGRDRCEKAVSPNEPTAVKPKPPAANRTTTTSRPTKALGDSMQRPTLPSASSGEAVQRLRAANAAADKADDEKFALSEQVEAKLAAWKGGKADNLRALLQSLDTVLWEGAGWKKVGMSDLVMPARVKIVYMKAIGKVHPDKIPQHATTEQRMVSAHVFSTLNEAWDKFKRDNNL